MIVFVIFDFDSIPSTCLENICYVFRMIKDFLLVIAHEAQWNKLHYLYNK